jgi:phosphoribosylformylglycinamidine synthase subunit PurSL
VTPAGKQWTLEVAAIDPIPAARRLAETARHMLGPAVERVQAIVRTDLYVVDREPSPPERDALGRAIADPGTQTFMWRVADARLDGQNARPWVEVALRAGVTDPIGDAVSCAAALLGLAPLRARSGSRYSFDEGIEQSLVATITDALLHNAIVDDVSFNTPIVVRFTDAAVSPSVETVPVRDLNDDALAALSVERGLALDPAELIVVRDYFVSIDRDPTDGEIETIAQTWSEHCSHKTFRAAITWDDGTTVEPLLAQLRRSTNEINAPFVVSAFVDNAGIITFDDDVDVAVKVETHNHPSAVEPFGGANTGVGGVIRDVLGVAADPIAVTDILCFGPLDLPIDELPAGVLHPQRIRHGVVEGIADYGNKLGLPTVAGAVCHQEGFTANPLVFAGCIGLRPHGLVLSGPEPGDRIVVLGGATGRDGIRGATFSSATMDATTGDVAGASVQIGDPIVEKLVADVLTEARGYGLFVGITDCGAGGFSSAVGEIAAELGADVDLDAAPRKYPGLAPWEVWLSEAQERMVLAVRPGNVAALAAICETHGVSMADLGSFRSDGQLVVRCGGEVLIDLPGTFLHDGRPTRELAATRPQVPVPAVAMRDVDAIVAGLDKVLLQVLAHGDVRSNEDIVRGFDHEILGATIGRPFVGAADDGPADAAVIAPLALSSGRGLAIGIGMNCRTGVIDARRMAEAAVDEAIRNVVAVGADPDRVALLDNFSWGDPRRPEMLGRLIDAVEGCCIAAGAHRSPFVSGKDSLNNEYMTSDGTRRSIPPTLVITALGVVPMAERLVTSDAKGVDNVLVLVGTTGEELRGSVLDAVLGIDGPGGVAGGDADAPDRYRAIHRAMVDGIVQSAHDLSDGGLVAALADMAMGGRLGAQVDLDAVGVAGHDGSGASRTVTALFSESSGRMLLEASPSHADELCSRTGGVVIGVVTDEDRLVITSQSSTVMDLSVDELLGAWRGHVS